MKKGWAKTQYAEYGAVAMVETRHNMAARRVIVAAVAQAVEAQLNA